MIDDLGDYSVFSNNDQFIYFSQVSEKEKTINKLDVANGEVTKVFSFSETIENSNDFIAFPLISSDNIMFFLIDNYLCKFNLEDNEFEKFDITVSSQIMSISPNGKYILAEKYSDTVIISTDGIDWYPLVNGNKARFLNNNQVIYSQTDRIYIVNTDGSDRHYLLTARHYTTFGKDDKIYYLKVRDIYE